MEENKKLRILMVHNYYQIPGGEDTVVANEKKMLEDHGHIVILYSRHNSEIKQMSKLQKLGIPFTTVFNPRTYGEIKNLIKQHQIDIVHVHNTLNLVSPAVYYAGLKCGVPVIQTVHNFRLLCPGATFYRDGHICEDCVEQGLWCAVRHKCYRESRMQTLACVISTAIHRMTGVYGRIHYICLTEFNKEKLLKLKQISPDRVFVKPNFVESTDEIIPQKQRENQFIFAGRLDKLKGIDVLLEAWKQMGENAPKLIVCGTGPMEEWCKRFVADNKVNVELRGFVPNYEVRELLAHSKALIFPTRWYEGFPMSVIESFSVGTPVVCSNIGNVGSIVEEGVNGCKFDVQSLDDMTSAVNRCEHLCTQTFEIFEKKYAEQINYQQLMDSYRKA